MGPRTMELVFSTCAVPGEGRARERERERELGRWRHYKDKCTLLIRQQHYTGLRQTPQVARATLGAGGLIHIETQAEVSLILLMGQQGDNHGRKAGVWDLDSLCLKSSTSSKRLGQLLRE